MTGCSSSNRTPAPEGRGARPRGDAATSLTWAVLRSVAGSREPRSAARGLGQPDEDAPALLAPHDLVLGRLADRLDVQRVELEAAALAPRAAQRTGPATTQLGPQLLVEGDRAGVETVDRDGALGADLLGVGVERRERGVALGLDRRPTRPRASRARS